MIWKIIPTSAGLLQLYLILIAAYKYDILFQDESILTPCENERFSYFNKYVDKSNMTYEFLSNQSLYVHGDYLFIKGFGQQKNPFRVDAFKKSRGTWVSTMYSVHRKDFCTSAFDPLEFWYKFTKENPDQTCPFREGRLLHYNWTADLTLNIPDPNFAGEYKVEILVELPGLRDVICANIYLDVYRSSKKL